MAHYFALSSKGYKLIEKEHKPHLVKRGVITTPNRSERDALRALIDCWTLNSVTQGPIKSIYHFKNCRSLRDLVGNNDGHLRSARIDNQNPNTVTNAFGQQSLNIQLQIGSNTYGNVLIPVNVNFGAHAIRAALLNALETGVVESMRGVPVAPNVSVPDDPGHIELPSLSALVALLGGAYMMIGGS
ncbi:hypothetical protein BGW38_005604 [Lunasporangiospora selenospora]|uniref:Uncharacterized protein n=1 Tax=Lunasporangiospora selenospora TaxID=979761 RepID=A0A9P6FN78_9FUNG|nr:hypothetical protein BGW38_005604 [Lunasporangiospora selenospora]